MFYLTCTFAPAHLWPASHCRASLPVGKPFSAAAQIDRWVNTKIALFDFHFHLSPPNKQKQKTTSFLLSEQFSLSSEISSQSSESFAELLLLPFSSLRTRDGRSITMNACNWVNVRWISNSDSITHHHQVHISTSTRYILSQPDPLKDIFCPVLRDIRELRKHLQWYL